MRRFFAALIARETMEGGKSEVETFTSCMARLTAERESASS